MSEMTLAELQNEVGRWGLETFPESTFLSIAKHLEEEAGEVKREAEQHAEQAGYDVLQGWHQERLAEECGDVLLILLHLAHRGEFNLLSEARKKFDTVKLARWQLNPEKGYAKRVKP